MVGDGCNTYDNSVDLIVGKDDDKEFLKNVFISTIGEPTWTPDTKNPLNGCYRVNGKKIRTFLYNLGLDYTTAGQKSIPWVIKQGSKEQAASFISGYWAADDCCSDRHIFCSTKSVELAHEIQNLLLMFGIVTTRTLDFVDGKEYQRVNVVGRS